MTMTPREIQEKQFHDAFRGYSHEEVDLFIDQVAEAYDQIYRENQAFNKRLEDLQGQLEGKPAPAVIPAPVTVQSKTAPPPPSQPSPASFESEDMLKRMLLTAQETADKAVHSARARAQSMIEEAEVRARRIEEQSEAISSTTLQDAQRRASETLSSLAQEEADFKERIEGLKTFERDFRSRLSSFVRSQLELLETRPLVSSAPLASSPSSGYWDRPRSTERPVSQERSEPRPSDPPRPSAETAQWSSQGDNPSGSESPGAVGKGTTDAQSVPAETRDTSASVTPAVGAPPMSSPGATESKSIRELFWGED